MSLPSIQPTCVVADDHPAILESLSCYLGKHGFQIVGRAKNGHAAVELIEAERPALAVLDARMPGLSGSAVIRHVTRSTPCCSAVLYSGYADHALLLEALDAGARGIVVKDAPLDTLVRALEVVQGGGMYIDAALAEAVIHRTPERRLGLTTRERDVLRLLADGHSNETIGRELFISPDTARTQIGQAMAKLGAATRTQAVATALRKSVII
jgi:DNA-binding NarL/FixJ family response regulator